MSSQLPPNPSIEQLRKRAKDLRRACAAADPEALARVRAHLPRLAQADDERLRAADIALQEAQHVIAAEHGYRNWNWLQAVVQVDFDILARLGDRETQVLAHAAGQQDMLVALLGAADTVRRRLLGGMSQRVRADVTEELEYVAAAAASEVTQARRRILQQAAELAREGRLDWPSGNGAPATAGDTPLAPSADLLDRLARPLDTLSHDEIATTLLELAAIVPRDGVLALEQVASGVRDPFLREALGLVVDGVEPPLLRDVLRTRSRLALLPQQDTRGKMVIEAMMAIQSGDNPRIVRRKMSTLYQAAETADPGDYVRRDVEALQERLAGLLRTTPYPDMPLAQIDELLTDMAQLARRAGIAALGPAVVSIEESLLRQGVRMIVAEVDPDEVVETLEARLAAELRESGMRQDMVIAGITALQQNRPCEEIGAEVKAAATATLA